jgi:hypothetical protein
MPQFSWEGRTGNGQAVSGTLDAPSKEAVVAKLRAQNIMVTTITEYSEAPARAARTKGRIGRILLGLLLIGGAAIMAMISKGTKIHCAQSGAAYDCTVTTTLAAVHTLYAEDIHGARTASDETQSAIKADRRGKGGRAMSSRVILASEAKTLSSEWLQNPFPNSANVTRDLNRAFAQNAASFDAWQIELAPAAIAVVLAVIGLLLVVFALRPRV